MRRLVGAVRDLVREKGRPGASPDIGDLPTRRELRTHQAITPREAFFARADHVKRAQAVGRISAELITPYPPGVPVLAPGEVVNEAIVAYLSELMDAGGYVEGAADPQLETYRVVAD